MKRARFWIVDKMAAAGLFVLGVVFHAISIPEEDIEPTGHLG